MFFIKLDEEDWRQTATIAAYVMLGVAGIIYAVIGAANADALFDSMSSVCGALILVGLTSEGAIWLMVMAFGKLKEARDRGEKRGIAIGIERGHEQMIQSMRESGLDEADIQKTIDNLNAGSNGKIHS